jgi:hypothetical protein
VGGIVAVLTRFAGVSLVAEARARSPIAVPVLVAGAEIVVCGAVDVIVVVVVIIVVVFVKERADHVRTRELSIGPGAIPIPEPRQ